MNRDKIIYISLMALGVLVIFFLFMGIREGMECTANPLVYGADQLSTEETGEFTCMCGFSEPKYNPIYFDKNNISAIDRFG